MRKVIIKSWKQMELEYGLNEDGGIDSFPYFHVAMEEALPESRVIEIDEGNYWNGWYISKNMILGEYIAPGTEIEVSCDKMKWRRRYFSGYIPVGRYRVLTFDDNLGSYGTYKHYRLIEEKPEPTKQEVFDDKGNVIGWFEPKGGE